MKRLKNSMMIIGLISLSIIAGCKKFLDEKPRKNLAVPMKLQDFQALLDLYPTVNSADPPCSEICSGDIYLTDADLAARSDVDRNMYLWKRENLYINPSFEWINIYNPIYYANSVLEGTAKYGTIGDAEWDNLKGQSYYLRAKSYLQATYIWALAYDEHSANSNLGLPMRLNTDFNQQSVRSSLAETYLQMEQDLKKAIPLLKIVPLHVMRASKPAAYGLLARLYLSMRNYDQAGLYADSCLKLKNSLQDFNLLDSTLAYPFKQFNTEVIAFSNMMAPNVLSTSRAKINPELYSLYTDGDLRPAMYFKDNGNHTYAYKGSFNGNNALFSGIATNEVYLIRAESYARLNLVDEALADLNTLLSKRFKPDKFKPITEKNPELLLDIILIERRKELPLRGLRWMDIKRLNKEGRQITLTRTYAGTVYALPPNSNGYALSIPDDIIALSGMQQNPK